MKNGPLRTSENVKVVPLAGIEPALLAESDFESDASTNSATGATLRTIDIGKPWSTEFMLTFDIKMQKMDDGTKKQMQHELSLEKGRG